MLVADEGLRWTVVHLDKGDPVVRRYPVPGGWIYQVSADVPAASDEDVESRNWYPPFFIPSAEVPRDA